jgi:hypothetical protein
VIDSKSTYPKPSQSHDPQEGATCCHLPPTVAQEFHQLFKPSSMDADAFGPPTEPVFQTYALPLSTFAATASRFDLSAAHGGIRAPMEHGQSFLAFDN